MYIEFDSKLFLKHQSDAHVAIPFVSRWSIERFDVAIEILYNDMLRYK